MRFVPLSHLIVLGVTYIRLFNCQNYFYFWLITLLYFKALSGLFKAIIHFRNRKKKVHRFTNNLQGLQRVIVKDFSWNIIPWNALLFEKTLKQLSILDSENYWFILKTCHDTAKCAETRVGFPVIFHDSNDRLSLNFHRFVILYISCDTRSVGLWALLFTESV